MKIISDSLALACCWHEGSLKCVCSALPASEPKAPVPLPDISRIWIICLGVFPGPSAGFAALIEAQIDCFKLEYLRSCGTLPKGTGRKIDDAETCIFVIVGAQLPVSAECIRSVITNPHPTVTPALHLQRARE